MENITFLHPEFFWLFVLFPGLIALYIFTQKKQSATLTMSSLDGFSPKSSFLAKIKILLFVLRLSALSLIIIGLARPQTVDVTSRTTSTQGVDIVIAIDVSGSMLAKDLKPNRLEALKRVASDFVGERPTDRIGLVIYAAESYTKTPVTSDKGIILNAIRDIRYDSVLQDGTAIGMGLATAVNRLKESKAKSKVIILMTDGENNSGFLEPRTAAEIAKEYGVKVYTIGIGTNGMAEMPYAYAPNGGFLYRMMEVKIDEALMRDIANTTGGKYYRATSNTKLNEIYDEINKLEKTDVEELKYFNYDEKYRSLILLAGVLLLLEFILRKTLFKSFI
ncbi:MAG: VWA domain-containing protein [Flavobacteriaceae bacterium]